MIKKRIFGLVAVLVGIGLITFLWTGGSYFYASYLENQWRSADPKVKSDLEKYLHFYSERIIEPKSSMWGRNYVLAENEKMVQYLILWSQPLDVVYDDRDNIKMIFTSYE